MTGFTDVTPSTASAFTEAIPNNTSWSAISAISTPDWDSSEEGDFTVGQNSYFIESTIGVKDWGYFRRPAQDHNWEEQTSLNWEDYA